MMSPNVYRTWTVPVNLTCLIVGLTFVGIHSNWNATILFFAFLTSFHFEGHKPEPKDNRQEAIFLLAAFPELIILMLIVGLILKQHVIPKLLP